MSNSQVGQVLGSATAVGAGAAILPITGANPLFMVLPVVAIICGLAILVSLSLTHVLETK